MSGNLGIVYFSGMCCKGTWPIARKIQEGSRRCGWLGMAGRQGDLLRRSPHVISWKETGAAGSGGGGGLLGPHEGGCDHVCSHHPALCNQPAACACLASSSCLDQSSRHGGRESEASSFLLSLGWGWSCSSHDTRISPQGEFCPQEGASAWPGPGGTHRPPPPGSGQQGHTGERQAEWEGNNSHAQ